MRALCRDGEYAVLAEFEQAFLDGPGGRYPLADHYGDVSCAAISAAGGWCVTGGEGVVVTRFGAGFPRRDRALDAATVSHHAMWRRANPPPGADLWWVHAIWTTAETDADCIHIAVEGAGSTIDRRETDQAGLFELNVVTMAWRPIVCLT